MSHIRHVVGNRNPSRFDTLRVDGDAQDLSEATVKLKMRLATGTTLKVDAAAVVVPAASTLTGSHSFPDDTVELASTTGFLPEGVVSIGGQLVEYTGISGNFLIGCTGGTGLVAGGTAVVQRGGVRYDWAAADVDTAGFYVAWWEVTLAGKTQDAPESPIELYVHSPFTAALCTLDQVREFLSKKGHEREQDAVIQMFIVRVSRAILNFTGRELAPATDDATRTFRVEPNRRLNGRIAVDLSPYDLRDVDTPGFVQLDPESSPTTLAATTDYLLQPTNPPDGVYSSLLLRSTLVLNSPVLRDYGFSQIAIRGSWGFASVPADVEQAAVVTVATWMRRDVQAWGSAVLVDDPVGRLERPEALPSAVRAMLGHYRRAPFA